MTGKEYIMARRVFYSFHYKPDNWRASQVRNMGVIEGNRPVSDNDWERITSRGDAAIEEWIDQQMYGKSCTVVLIGSRTGGRKWINYEITKSWKDGKGVLGVYIHNLKDFDGAQTDKGRNPFDWITVGQKRLSSIVKAHDPRYSTSTNVYNHIKENLAAWVDEAITIRDSY